MSSSSSGSGSDEPGSAAWSSEQEASAAALAFKAVAVSWRELEQEMTRLFMALQVLDFCYLGVSGWWVYGRGLRDGGRGAASASADVPPPANQHATQVLWYATGDMTAPCVAALLANAVDYQAMWARVQPSSGGGSGGAYGYPCQNPDNWNTDQCHPPLCEADGTCPEYLVPEGALDE